MSTELRWESIPSGMLRCVGTVIWSPSTKSAVLIDPTDDPSTFVRFLDEQKLSLKALLLTHAHVDHATGTCEVAKRFGLVPRLNRDDWPLFSELPKWAPSLGIKAQTPDIAPESVEDGDTIEIEDGFSLRVLHTPGHTPGQVAYYSETLGLVVVGDTLFFGSVGRTDLPGGSMEQLSRSIRQKLYGLPDATVVVPGHGPRTTIGHEKRNNPYVKAL